MALSPQQTRQKATTDTAPTEEYSDEALLAELRRVADYLQGQRLTTKQFNSLARVHCTTVARHFGSWQNALDRAGISETIAPRLTLLSREKVLQALRDFACERPGQSITRDAIAEKLGVDGNSLTRRLGSWERLLAEAGIATPPHEQEHTDDECFDNISKLWKHYGRQPNFLELARAPSTAGPKAYIRRWGGWQAALCAFAEHRNEREKPPSE